MLALLLNWYLGWLSSYHEVKPGHKQDEVSQKDPMPLQCNFSFLDKSFSNIRAILADFLALKKRLRLGKAKTECNNKDWRTCSEPE
jgi:hypothetical protein